MPWTWTPEQCGAIASISVLHDGISDPPNDFRSGVQMDRTSLGLEKSRDIAGKSFRVLKQERVPAVGINGELGPGDLAREHRGIDRGKQTILIAVGDQRRCAYVPQARVPATVEAIGKAPRNRCSRTSRPPEPSVLVATVASATETNSVAPAVTVVMLLQSGSNSFDQRDERLPLFDDIGGELRPVAAANVLCRVDSSRWNEQHVAGLDRR